ncbi:MAG: hypothetical protein AAFU61_05095, partial [Pseudomonadota bacterium]
LPRHDEDEEQREDQPAYSRLCIGARREVRLLLDLCRGWEGPFALLFILVMSRQGNPLGRYQSPLTLSFEEVERFLLDHEGFLERDGRHHLWLRSMSGGGQLVLDRHRIVYGYGDVDAQEAELRRLGFEEGPVDVPIPHGHRYHEAFDAAETAVMEMERWPWIRSPLQPIDEA